MHCIAWGSELRRFNNGQDQAGNERGMGCEKGWIGVVECFAFEGRGIDTMTNRDENEYMRKRRDENS